MYRGIDRSPFGRLLKAAVWMSLTCASAMLVVGLFRRSLSGSTGQVLLSAVGILAASAGIILMFRARGKAGPAMAMLLTGGVATTGVWVMLHLALVWAGYADHPVLWRLWWVTLIPSAAVALVVAVQIASMRRGGSVENFTTVMAGWAALMLMWIGLRAGALTGVSATYWWVFAFPAFSTAGGALYVLTRRLLGAPRPACASRSTVIILLIVTHAAAAVCAYEIGKAVCREDSQVSRDAADR